MGLRAQPPPAVCNGITLQCLCITFTTSEAATNQKKDWKEIKTKKQKGSHTRRTDIEFIVNINRKEKEVTQLETGNIEFIFNQK